MHSVLPSRTARCNAHGSRIQSRNVACSSFTWAAAGRTSAAILSAATILGSLQPAALASSLQIGEVVVGVPRVVDGDTLYVQGNKMRLYGIDAPEKQQSCKDGSGKDYACGQDSLQALTAKLANRTVSCSVKAIDQYGRNVAACALPGLGGSEDVNGWLVDNGLAVAYRQYGKEYIPAEEAAHAAKKGIWSGTFTMPAEWRKIQKANGASTANASVDSQDTDLGLPEALMALLPFNGAGAAPPVAALPLSSGGGGVVMAKTCPGGAPALIKGNINSKKDKIYHVPGGQYYDKVQIDTASGEQFFCSEQEAVAAGWRKSSN